MLSMFKTDAEIHWGGNGILNNLSAGPSSSDRCASDWYECRGFNPLVRQHSMMEIGHEIIPMAILSLLLIQVGQLSVTCERMCTKYWLIA